MKPTCLWVVAAASFNRKTGDYKPPVRCGKPVKWIIVSQTEGRRIRRYDSFCPEHKNEKENHEAR